jgi:hypothetical protein
VKPVIKKIFYVIIVFLTLAIAVFIGKTRQTVDPEGEIFSAFSDVKGVKQVSENFYYLYDTHNTFGQPVAILSIAKAEGYSGPIQVGVKYDKEGIIQEVKILSQSETPGFFRRVERAKFWEQYKGRSIQETFHLGENIDGVTAATISCSGINSAVGEANRRTCDLHFKEKFAAARSGIKIQAKDFLIFFLYLFAILLSYTGGKIQKRFLPVFRLISLLFLGFFFKSLLSITHFNNLLMGNFPGNQYYWYLVIGFFLFCLLVLGKNLYFAYICPMGILQDYLGKLPVKKIKFRQKKYYQYPAVLLTLGILIYAAVANQPGFMGHEIFGAVFQFQVKTWLFGLGVICLVLSLFIRRFWCRFLCPVGVIGRFLQIVRSIFTTRKR